MQTPICDFAAQYLQSGFSRLHMPGHKGIPFLGPEPYDLTEIRGADSLYEATGIIAQSEQNATALFGTKRTLYSTEGSSQCIRAMLSLALMHAEDDGKRPVVLAARNAHRSFLSACALLDLDVEWLYPQEGSGSVCSCPISASALEETLSGMPRPPFAVFVTSPDYLGGMLDLAALSAVCRKHNVLFLVDNAHGAYLKFLPVSLHPMDLGADLCCDSAHKTLPVLTGGAYLHLALQAPDRLATAAKGAMALFGSTSPSYLVLQSLDRCNRLFSEEYPNTLAACAEQAARLKALLLQRGCAVLETEPLKLVFDAHRMGWSGFGLADRMREYRIECEYADADYVVLMLSPQNTQADFERIEKVVESLSAGKAAMPAELLRFDRATAAMTIRQAIFARHEILPVADCEGRVCGAPTVSCPPAVPIVVSGEVITPQAVALLKRYGVRTVEVVAQ